MKIKIFEKLINNYYRNRLNKTEIEIQEAERRIKYEESSLGNIDDLARAGFYRYSDFSASAYHADKGEAEINISNMKQHLNSLEIKRNRLINKLNLTNKNAN